MTTNFIVKGTDAIKEAVFKDNNDDFEEALNLYSLGIQYLMIGMKYEKNIKVYSAVKEKIKKYLARAEDIKKSLSQEKNIKKNMENSKKKMLKNENSNKKEEEEEIEDEETKKLKNSLSTAIIRKKPNVKWNDIAGLDIAKDLLKEAVIIPMRFPQLFTGQRKPWQGILLYGPPGTGKSYLAKAVATEAKNSTFFSVSSSDVVTKFVGESERLVKSLYDMARKKKPLIIFIDEIDALASARSDGEAESSRRIKTEFLVQMQGVGKDCTGVLTLGATNCPWDLDVGIRRRFMKRIYIPLPKKEARKTMFKIHVGNTPNKLQDKDYEILAKRTPGFSGSDIYAIVQDALMEPVRTMQKATHFKKIPNKENGYFWIACSPGDKDGKKMSLLEIPEEEEIKVRSEDLKLAHFLRVLKNVKPSVCEKDIIKHIDWTEKFGQTE